MVAGRAALRSIRSGQRWRNVQGQRAVERFAHQCEGLRVIALAGGAQLVADLGALVHGLAAQLAERGQAPGQRVFGVQRAELIQVVDQQAQEHLRVGRVVLGAGGREGFADAGAGGRVDGIDGEPGHVEEQVDERAVAGFQRQGDGPAAEALLDLLEPGADVFRGVVEGGGFGGGGPGFTQGQGVLTVAPVQADAGGEAGFCRGVGRVHGGGCVFGFGRVHSGRPQVV